MAWLRHLPRGGAIEDVVDLLRNVETFQGLEEKQLRRLAEVFEVRTLRRGEILFEQGDAARCLYLVKEGFVDIEVLPEYQGTACVPYRLVSLGRGQSVGEMCLVDRGSRSATVRAATDGAVVASASFSALDALAQADPRTGYRIMRNIAADLSFRLRQRDQEA